MRQRSRLLSAMLVRDAAAVSPAIAAALLAAQWLSGDSWPRSAGLGFPMPFLGAWLAVSFLAGVLLLKLPVATALGDPGLSLRPWRVGRRLEAEGIHVGPRWDGLSAVAASLAFVVAMAAAFAALASREPWLRWPLLGVHAALVHVWIQASLPERERRVVAAAWKGRA